MTIPGERLRSRKLNKPPPPTHPPVSLGQNAYTYSYHGKMYVRQYGVIAVCATLCITGVHRCAVLRVIDIKKCENRAFAQYRSTPFIQWQLQIVAGKERHSSGSRAKQQYIILKKYFEEQAYRKLCTDRYTSIDK